MNSCIFSFLDTTIPDTASLCYWKQTRDYATNSVFQPSLKDWRQINNQVPRMRPYINYAAINLHCQQIVKRNTPGHSLQLTDTQLLIQVSKSGTVIYE